MSKSLGGVILFVALGMRLIGGDIANLGYFVLAIYALLGPAQAIRALALLWLFSVISPAIAPGASMASISRFLPIGGAFASLLLHNQAFKVGNSIGLYRPVLVTLILGAFLIAHSILFSELVIVSVLKIISWTMVMTTLLWSWTRLNYQERTRLEMQLFGGLGLMMLISFPLVFTSIGYFNNNFGFQGVLNQSQAFGLTVALLASWLFGRLSEKVQHRWIDIALLGLCLIVIMMSETRTAGFSLILAIVLTIFVFIMKNRKSIRPLIKGTAIIFTIVVIGLGPSDRLNTFIMKRDNITDLTQITEASRGVLIYPMIDNIEDRFITGIGFGVASAESNRWVDRHNLLNIPTSAPVEKGVMPIAVLEEIGGGGFLVVTIWLWFMSRRAARAGIPKFLVFSYVLFTNLGEASLFSPGGMGLLYLIMLAWAVTLKDHVNPSSIDKHHFATS